MTEIIRNGTTRRWSESVAWQGLLWLCEVANDLDGDMQAQTREVLDNLAASLGRGRSDKGRILNATIYIPHPEDLAEFNAQWDNWLPAGSAPVRACVHAALTDPRMRVEIQALAAGSGNAE